MRPFLVFALLAATAASAARPAQAVPALARAPRLDGSPRELSPAVTLNGGTFTAKVAYRQSTLYVGLITGATSPKDLFEVSLHFPDAGVTAPGYVFRVAPQGKVSAPTGDESTPAFADAQVKAAAQVGRAGFSAELAIPLTAFPRFPLKGPMTLELCVTLHAAENGETHERSNCQGGAMPQPLRLPDALRRGLGLKPPSDVVSLEASDGGWLGYGVLLYPRWIQASEPIDAGTLKRLLPSEAVDPDAVGVGLPRKLQLPRGGELLSVLSGHNPYEQPGTCDGDKELRLGLFLVHGKSAERVLDFPAANCALGRATSVVLDEEGALTISYTNGATTHFTWSGDHFEQTQIG